MAKSILKLSSDQVSTALVPIADSRVTAAPTGEQASGVAGISNQHPTDACHEAIRVLAHRKWEAAGCPAGDGITFWLEAEREISAERSGASSAQG